MPKPWACAQPPRTARCGAQPQEARSMRPVRAGAGGARAGVVRYGEASHYRWRYGLPRARVPPMLGCLCTGAVPAQPRAIAGIPPQDV